MFARPHCLRDSIHILRRHVKNGGSDYKYCNGSYEECGEIINKYVAASPVDILRFFRLILFNFISLNDDTHSAGQNEFMEFARRIGVPEKLAKREIERFSMENPLADSLIRRSFLSDELKEQYRLSMNYRRRMLTF